MIDRRFAALFALALVALLPLRLVAGHVPGLSARAASGPVWSGHLDDAAYGPVLLGDVDARLALLPLLLGRAEVEVHRDDFTARLSSGGISDATGTLATRAGLGPLPVEALTLDHVAVRWRDGACIDAQGRIGLTLALPGLASSLALSGAPRCAGDTLLLPLQGPGGMERLTLRVTGDGHWRADLVLSGLSEQAATPLRALGLVPRADGIGLRTTGHF